MPIDRNPVLSLRFVSSRFALLLVLLATCFSGASAQSRDNAGRAGILRFNQRLEDATRRMDNTATLALWAEDGVSLLPGTIPLIGKPAIAAFLHQVTASLAGAKMQSFSMHCSGIVMAKDGGANKDFGNLASEWCVEHQVVALPGGKPPFDGRGQMLLVLRRNPAGEWLLAREMWSAAANP